MKKCKLHIAAFITAISVMLTGCSRQDELPSINELPEFSFSPAVQQSTSASRSSSASDNPQGGAVSSSSEFSSSSAPASSSSSSPAYSTFTFPFTVPRSSRYFGPPLKPHPSVSSYYYPPALPTAPISKDKPEPIDPNTCEHIAVVDAGRIPEADAKGLSQGSHCSICKKVLNRRRNIEAMPNYQPTSIAGGTAVYTDKNLGDLTVSYDSIPTEQSVYQTLISFKDKYPEGTPFNDADNRYLSEKVFPNVKFTGYGCVAFALELSDAAFGDLPGRYSFDYDNVRVGDIIRLDNDKHSAIVLEVSSDTVTIAEGNYNNSVHWERTLNKADAVKEWNYIITRYPN